MMGATHAISGAVAYLAVAPAVALVHRQTPGEVALYTLVTAGAAMVPDLDHPQSSIARTFGFATQALADLVHHLSGGHRKATHSLVGAAIAGAVASGLTVALPALGRALVAAAGPGLPRWVAELAPQVSAVAVVALALGLGVRALGITPGGLVNNLATFAGCTAVAMWAANAAADLRWVPLAYVLGCLAHVAGDWCTEQGVPWLWPARRRYRIATIDTSEWVETLLVAPALTAAGALLVAVHAGWWPHVRTAVAHAWVLATG